MRRRGAVVAAAWLAAAACAAPEAAPAPLSAAPQPQAQLVEEILGDPIYSLFWAHVYLGITPTFQGSQLMSAIYPDNIAHVVVLNGGVMPEELAAAGVPQTAAAGASAASLNASKLDSLLLYTSDWQLLSWLPIKFWAVSPSDKILVFDPHR